MRSNPRLVIIVGPTSSGKSAYGVDLAKKIGGEIVSADSRQVYKGFDLTSGKITKKEMRGVPHHLLDVASPRRPYSAARYKFQAEKAIRDILKRGRVPIIVGGTGFYIDTILYSSLPEVKPDPRFRKKLELRPAISLFKELEEKDPARAKTIDPKNKRRLIRALEIIESTGQPVPPHASRKISSFLEKLGISEKNILKIGLTLPKEKLQERIHQRIITRLKRGMISEVNDLHKDGLSWKRLEELGLEYKWLSRFLRGLVTREEMILGLEKDTWQYARRQMTWWRKDKDIQWLAPPQD